MSKSVGIAVGGLIFVALMVAGYFLWWKKRRPVVVGSPAPGSTVFPSLTGSNSSLVQSVPTPTIIGKPIGGPGLGAQIQSGVATAATAGCQAVSAAYGVGAIGGLACGPAAGLATAATKKTTEITANAAKKVGSAAASVASKLKFW
jgi:hypothetical protein